MAWDLILARLLHIGGAFVWAGLGLSAFFFFLPAQRMAGKAGDEYWQVLVSRRPFVQTFAIAGIVTVAAGAYLYWRLGYFSFWNTTLAGQVLTAGALAGILALGVELLWQMSLAIRMGRLRAGFADGGPDKRQAARERRLLAEFRWADRTSSTLLIVAIATMATARFW